jgi:hypothetical protein
MRCNVKIGDVPVTHSHRAGARSWNLHSNILYTNFRNSVGQVGHRDTVFRGATSGGGDDAA